MALNLATLRLTSCVVACFSMNGMKSSGLKGLASLALCALAKVDATTPDL